LTTLATLLALSSAAFGGDSPDTKEIDRRIDRALFDTISLGAPLYNAGDPYGCYRLYQGTAMALLPLSSQSEGLREILDAGLKRAEAQPRYDQRATVLRESFDKARGLIAGRLQPAKPLWDRLGGELAVKAVVHDFVAMAAGDPKVDFTRGGKYPVDAAGVANLERRLVELISAVSGGPLKYTGRDMKSAHAGMGISDAEFDALGADLVAVLKKYYVPKRETDELLAAVVSTRKDIVEAPGAASTAAAAKPDKSLFDRLGGEPAVVAVVDDFVARAAGDPKVNFTRKGTASEWQPTAENVETLKKHLVQLIGATTGGPIRYEGRGMKEVHKGMMITGAEFDAIAVDLKATLDKFQVPEKEQQELFKIVGSTRAEMVERP
jgi:hemoglobin